MRTFAPLLALLTACGPSPIRPTPVEVSLPHLADGQLASWVQARPLPVARANHCSIAFKGFLLVAGGNYRPAGATEFVTLDDVQAAPVAGDGTLGEWKRVGTLPRPGVDCVVALSDRKLVLLGGLFTDSTLNGKVWTATLGDDATLSEWKEVGTLPYGRRALSGGAAARNGTVWVSDTRLESEGAPEAIWAHAKLGDTLGPWTTTVYSRAFRGKPLGALTASAAFIIGGYGSGSGGNAVLTDVTGMGLNEQATPASTTALPERRTYGAAEAADNFVFVVGGRNEVLGVPPTATVWVAKADGASLSAWTEVAPLPEARSNHTVTAVRDHLFVVGGGNGAGGLDSIFAARVKREPPGE